MRLLLDTSVLIADNPTLPAEESGISVASLVELHFGARAARDAHERSPRLARLGRIESEFVPVPVDAATARAWLSSLRAESDGCELDAATWTC